MNQCNCKQGQKLQSKNNVVHEFYKRMSQLKGYRGSQRRMWNKHVNIDASGHSIWDWEEMPKERSKDDWGPGQSSEKNEKPAPGQTHTHKPF